ncbi:unnamed protein product [Haemonchus placei]|uniref:tRNA-synt_2c domain-containing protein n=1 Tax=Haemonchus placei TaxID=6290 RepID=A0A0N4W9H2_HAEPC|nr:unnamed protein product [Haemonchus placei]
MGTVKNKVYELNIGHCSVVQWEQYFRDVCAEYYRRKPPVIGGFGCTVEIDETLVARIVVDVYADTSGFLAVSREGADEHF